jgi:hypothetical protein
MEEQEQAGDDNVGGSDPVADNPTAGDNAPVEDCEWPGGFGILIHTH